jgi:hypothetical protein
LVVPASTSVMPAFFASVPAALKSDAHAVSANLSGVCTMHSVLMPSKSFIAPGRIGSSCAWTGTAGSAIATASASSKGFMGCCLLCKSVVTQQYGARGAAGK